MKIKLLGMLVLFAALTGCHTTPVLDKTVATGQLNTFMDDWHLAAANADADGYFGAMNDQSIFIGTDALENWRKGAFFLWSKKYFERGKAWSFKAIDRNIYFSDDGKVAWFDELLDTPNLGICRGSGVVRMTASGWKIEHYVLSVTSPNETVDKVTELNEPFVEGIKAKFN